MSSDYITLGSAPADEECVQVGTENYEELAKAECTRYITFLRTYVGKEPAGAVLHIKSFNHDFGLYYEVCCCFDPQNTLAFNYAQRCESEAPLTWSGVE